MKDLYDPRKPRHEYFYELIRETHKALSVIRIINADATGIDSLLKSLKKHNINLAHGSLRFDRDEKGNVFMQEFRPGSGLIQRGYFHSVHLDRPLWEIVGTAIVRLAYRKERERKAGAPNMESDYCIILQGSLNIKFILQLIKEGRVSYNTRQEHLREEPIFFALVVLSKLKPEQVIQTRLKNRSKPEADLKVELSRIGQTTKDIACLIGKNEQGQFYTAPQQSETSFPVNVCSHKVVPIEIAQELNKMVRLLIRKRKLLVLDNLSFTELSQCLTEREKHYYEIAME